MGTQKYQIQPNFTKTLLKTGIYYQWDTIGEKGGREILLGGEKGGQEEGGGEALAPLSRRTEIY